MQLHCAEYHSGRLGTAVANVVAVAPRERSACAVTFNVQCQPPAAALPGDFFKLNGTEVSRDAGELSVASSGRIVPMVTAVERLLNTTGSRCLCRELAPRTGPASRGPALVRSCDLIGRGGGGD